MYERWYHFSAVFGKLMENVMKYRNIKLISTAKQHARYTSKPQMKKFHILSDDLVCLELAKTKACLNKPICAGFTVLDLSKLHMYKFFYQVMLKEYGNRMRLLFTGKFQFWFFILRLASIAFDKQMNKYPISFLYRCTCAERCNVLITFRYR
jgi:hypothetical protein